MGNSESSKKRVCIIGAGPSGLAALKEFTSSDAFHVVCMEQLSVVGGLWNYSDVIKQADHPTGSNYTAVYKNFKTYTPKQMLQFSDISYHKDLPTFIRHADVKDYLWSYAKSHKLEKCIKFNTRVTSVKPKTLIGREDAWEVESLNVQKKKTETNEFDIVIVCNGINFKAHIPVVKGMQEFKGAIMHSQEFRNPENFKDKNVMIVGAGRSGVEIAIDISKTAKKVWLSQKSDQRSLPDCIEQVGEVMVLTQQGVVVKKWKEMKISEQINVFEMSNESKEDQEKRLSQFLEKENSLNEKRSLMGSIGDKGTKDKVPSALCDVEEEGELEKIEKDQKSVETKDENKSIKRGVSNEPESMDNDDAKATGNRWKTASSKIINRTNVPETIKSEPNDIIKNSDNIKTQNKEIKKPFGDTKKSLGAEATMRINQVDVIIFCTGFSYSLPFLNADCGVSVMCKSVVGPLYKDSICLARQSLAFIGLNKYGTFKLLEYQAKFLKMFYEEKLKIPKYGKELLKMVEEDNEKKILRDVDVLKNPMDTPFYQWEMMNELAMMAGFARVPETYERLYREVAKQRKLSNATYQDIEYELGPDGFYRQKI